MITKLIALITILYTISRPALMPLVNQNPELQSVSTKDQKHAFVKLLEKQYAGSGKSAELFPLSLFDFVSCNVFGENARLVYCRTSEEKDKEGNPQIECLLIMFQKQNNLWQMIHLNRIFATPLKLDDHSDCVERILKDNQEFSLPKDDEAEE